MTNSQYDNMETIHSYYKILDVNESATIEDIKRSYRDKVKKYHPDINKQSNASELFVQLTEAYEYLLQIKSSEKQINIESIKIKQRESQARARKFANMKYEEFINSEYYKTISSLDTIFDHIYFYSAIFILIILPIVLFVFFWWKGLIIGLIIAFITLPLTAKTMRKKPQLNFRAFKQSLIYISKKRQLFIGLLVVANLFLFIRIGFQTLFPTVILTIVFLSIPIIGIVISKIKPLGINKAKVQFISLILFTMSFNAFLLLNYFFSKNPIEERYEFSKTYERSRRGLKETTFIILADNKYSEYPGIRLFFDYDEIKGNSHILYTFKEGFFGIRVMTDHRFEK